MKELATDSPNDGPSMPERIDTDGRVVVAMSGGVDSSVVAAWLADQGHDVVGISMRLYAEPKAAGKSCCSPDDLYDARAIAASHGFPFYVANYQQAFQERVVDYFVSEYRNGRTPSPCILCNDHLKFDILLERMLALGGDTLVTGHYARIEERDGRWQLLRGVDRRKDQSYFLFGLQRDVLPNIRFPLGGLVKHEVRELGRRLGVATADKAESQDICFVGGGSYVDVLEEHFQEGDVKPGNLVRKSTGEVLGEHAGIHRFTVGQRRGLGISYKEPLFVRSIDAASGTVFVGTRDEVNETTFTIERCNWLRWECPPEEFEAVVKVRYRHQAVACAVRMKEDGTGVVTLVEAERGIAPGQAAVFYHGDEVLGGGWIDEVITSGDAA